MDIRYLSPLYAQSYNCGHDDAVFEATARTAGMSANKGIVYYSASGAWSPSGVGRRHTVDNIHCVLLSPSCRGPGTGKSYNARLPRELLLTVVVLISQCPPSTDPVPYCAEEWTPQQAGLPEWNADEEAVLKMKQALFLFNEDKPSYARYFRFYCPAQYL
jgi:hypothetical protein